MGNEKLKLWHTQNRQMTYHAIKDVYEALLLMNKLIKQDIANSSIVEEAFGLVVYDKEAYQEDSELKGVYVEWYCDDGGKFDGLDINGILDLLEEESQDIASQEDELRSTSSLRE